MASQGSTIKVADYLLLRLRELGIDSIFGVPGDYNLRLLDFVEPNKLHWVGNCNELNSAYAADGYARVKRISALITTFGVGELSAINGIAGAYAERAAVIHIVGSPSRTLQKGRKLMHHTLAEGSYRHFAKMAEHVTVAQESLWDPVLIPGQIDSILIQALRYSRPVYLELPDDVVDVYVSAASLATPLSVPPSPALKETDASTIIKSITERIYAAKQPAIIVDGESLALGLVENISKVVNTTKFPTWTTVFGKGLVDEQLPNVFGTYQGSFGDLRWKEYLDSADLILEFGPHYTDTNTQGFTTMPDPAKTISFGENLRVGASIKHDDIARDILSQLVRFLDKSSIPTITGPTSADERVAPQLEPNGIITQAHFFGKVNSIFRENDLILTETGTSSHAGRDFKLPTGSRWFGAYTWLSIGYMLPATLGAALAQREKVAKAANGGNDRAILFIGDGSLQMTVQEISTIVKERLNVIIFLINNDGYTIERVIHGRKQGYNDIASWNHEATLRLFGTGKEQSERNYFTMRNWQEVDSVLGDKSLQDGEGVKIVEVFMDREDATGILKSLLEKQIKAEGKTE